MAQGVARRGRASARLGEWTAVSLDLARSQPVESLSVDDAIHFKALDLVARHKTGNSVAKDDAERTEAALRADLSVLDKVELAMLTAAVAEIRSGQIEVLKKQLSQRLSGVEALLKQKKHDAAWSELDAIAKDSAVKSLVASPSGGPTAFNFARLRLTTLGQLPTAKAADIEQELTQLAVFFVSRPAPPAGWIVQVVTGVKTIALRQKPGSNELLSPPAADRALRMLIKAQPVITDEADRKIVNDVVEQLRARRPARPSLPAS